MDLCGSYRVTAIAKPIDALIYLKKYRPDLILLDYKMPEMSGTEFFAKIEADSGVRTLTLENTLPDVRDYITKPVEGVRLIATMRKWLPQDKLIFDIPEEEPEEAISFMEIVEKIDEFPGINS